MYAIVYNSIVYFFCFFLQWWVLNKEVEKADEQCIHTKSDDKDGDSDKNDMIASEVTVHTDLLSEIAGNQWI